VLFILELKTEKVFSIVFETPSTVIELDAVSTPRDSDVKVILPLLYMTCFET